MKAPLVFVSHASEDKPIVEPLARRLRADGVDAWLDKWEMVGGDSLVDKIMEEGIKNCDVFLIVLSRTSVQKPWVREELNAAFAQRIEKSTRLVAVRLDDCEVPVVLKDRVWINMHDRADESKYRDLLNAIFQETNKPPLGPSAFAMAPAPAPGLNHDETAVLYAFARHALEQGTHTYLQTADVADATGLAGTAIQAALEMLEAEGDVKVTWFIGRDFAAQITPWGWQKSAMAIGDIDAEQDALRVVALLASEGPLDGCEVHARSGFSETRALLAFQLAKVLGLVKAQEVMSGDLLGFVHAEATPAGRKRVR